MKTALRLAAALSAGALLAACSDSPAAPVAAAAARTPAAAPSLALSGTTDNDPVFGPVTVTLRVENPYYEWSPVGVTPSGGAAGLYYHVEVPEAKVRFSMLNASGATIQAKGVLDNGTGDLDKRVGYFKLSMTAGKTLKTSLLSVPFPWTTAKTGTKTVLVTSDQLSLTKMLVSRVPRLAYYFDIGSDTSVLVSHTIKGPNGYSRTLSRNSSTSYYEDVRDPGTYTICVTTPAGWMLQPNTPCVQRSVPDYDTLGTFSFRFVKP